MLLANQCAANAGRTRKAPFVYRIHEAPDAERMEKLMTTLKACGVDVRFKGETPTQLELAALLDKTRGEPIQIPVHTGVLRSMQKARYDVEPKGHFGLVLADYAPLYQPHPPLPRPGHPPHPDRHAAGRGRPAAGGQIPRLCPARQRPVQPPGGWRPSASSGTWRTATKAEYMTAHLGETYTGTVSGVTQRGVFVALDNTVEGFVPSAELCKGEPVVTEGVRVYDPLTGRHWMLGDPMQVQVATPTSSWAASISALFPEGAARPQAAIRQEGNPCRRTRKTAAFIDVRQGLQQALTRCRNPPAIPGGEYNEVIKDPAGIDVRFAFCFPDTYEIGMSFLAKRSCTSF